MKSISFIIPLYKSETTIAAVVEEIVSLKLENAEVVLVNDASPDNVEEVVFALHRKYPQIVKYLRLSKNQGQHTAILTGLKYASKEVAITIDDDGQNSPSDTLKLAEKLIAEDLDVVYGYFANKSDSLFKKLASRLNREISVYAIGNKNKLPITNVRAISRVTYESMNEYNSSYPYIDGIIFALTNRISGIDIPHHPRTAGASSYTLWKLLRLWTNHLLGYSNILLKLITVVSFLASLISLLAGLAYLFVTIGNTNRPEGWLSTYLTTTLLFSLLFLLIGIISEYIGRMYLLLTKPRTKLISKQL